MTKIVYAIGLALLIALPSWAADEAGLIKVAKGTVMIERGGQTLNASAGMPVLIGDRITTGEESSIGITLRDNTLLSAGPKSTLLLNSFAFKEMTHDGTLDASLKRGTLSVVSGKLSKNPSNSVKFRTPAAILGVRGTEFVIDAGSGK
ncbi:MAG: FecR domain-containing protein [Deltaproteobacteria bacterium]|nr:FecR domain-containing protein [Deltaproteobacteria bacterium]